LTFEGIIKDLKAGQYSPIYLLHGEESYYIDQIVDYIEDHVLSDGEKAFNQMVFYGKDVDFKSIVDAARQFPMMASHRVVIVKEAQDMRTLKNLENYADNPSPQTLLVLAHKHKKFDSRTKLAKSIKSNGIIFESKKLYDNQVQQWISNYFKSKGYTIDAEASMMAAEYLGTDLSKVVNEMDKVIVNVKEGVTITKAMIQEMVGISKDYNVFELQKAISQGNTEKAFRIVEYFGENEKANPLVVILSNLYNYFYKVYLTAYHSKENDNELKKMLGLPTPFFVKEYREASKRYHGKRLIDIFDALKSADLKSKGVGARKMETKSILRDFLIQVFY